MIMTRPPEVKNGTVVKPLDESIEIDFAKGQGDVLYSLFSRRAPGEPGNEDPLK